MIVSDDCISFVQEPLPDNPRELLQQQFHPNLESKPVIVARCYDDYKMYYVRL